MRLPNPPNGGDWVHNLYLPTGNKDAGRAAGFRLDKASLLVITMSPINFSVLNKEHVVAESLHIEASEHSAGILFLGIEVTQ